MSTHYLGIGSEFDPGFPTTMNKLYTSGNSILRVESNQGWYIKRSTDISVTTISGTVYVKPDASVEVGSNSTLRVKDV